MSGVAAILLSAGESRRMGHPKALLPWRDSSLLRHQVTALTTAGAERVVVVLGHQPDNLLPELQGLAGVDWVINKDYLQGKTTSIKTGVRAVIADRPDCLLMLNVDQPRSAGAISRVLQEHQSGSAVVTIPTYNGKGGHPIVLDGSVLDELLNINEETLGIKAVVQRHQESVRRVELGIPELLWDMNTPEQYEAVRSVISSQ